MNLDDDIMVRFLSLGKIKALKEQILSLAKQSFYSVLADAAGGKDRFDEMMDAYYQAGKKVRITNPGFDPQTYAEIPGFLDTWNAADLDNIVSMCIFAFDRRSGELFGLLIQQDIEGYRIYGYMGSLHDYWTENFKRGFIRSELRISKDIKKNIEFRHDIKELTFTYERIIKPSLTSISNGIKVKAAKKKLKDILNF